MKVNVCLILLAAFGFTTKSAGIELGKPQAVMPKKHFAVLENYCFDCHDAATKKGGVNLEALSFTISTDLATAERWKQILNAINSGEMPPAKKTQISAAEKTAFLGDLSIEMVAARKILSDTGGKITMRRLNRREYQNTIESLLGIRPDVSDLPDDQGTSGFDTAGASLFFSSDQLEQYLAIARKSLELALKPTRASKANIVRIQPEDEFTPTYAARAEQYRDNVARSRAYLAQSTKPPSAFGFIDQNNAEKSMRGALNYLPMFEDYLKRPETKHGATLISTIKNGVTRIKLPTVNGGAGHQAIIRVRASVYKDAAERFRYLEFTAKTVGSNASVMLGWRRVTGTIETPQIIEFPVSVPAGERVQYSVHQRTHQGRGDKNLWAIHKDENGIGTKPGLWVDWAELETPPVTNGRSAVAAKLFFSKPEGWSEDRYARAVIEQFAKRAFRTTEPSADYMEKLFTRYAAKRAKGESMQDAIIDPLSIVLASPSFLYMVESRGGNTKLTDLELAVRLSYLLWSAPPDDQLLAVARDGQLSKPDILKRETARLLADARSDQFVHSFVHQWLDIDRIDMFQFDARLHPTFDNAARESAREEIFQTVHMMLKDKLPLKALLKADFVVVNDVLAGYYGLDGVNGHEFRKVSLPAGSPRGGLLGSAAVHAMGSDGNRSSPVERGAWVLRYLLHDPPPPAPPNVPQLSRLDGEVLSARALQRAHQEEPQCAQCHRKIDPIGYGMENFSAAGLWREEEFIRSGKRKAQVKAFPIDSSGSLPNGKEFTDFNSLRDAVATQVDPFARGLTESLISYGLGRPYGFTDQDLADQILKSAQADEYELSQFIHALVQSKPFQSK